MHNMTGRASGFPDALPFCVGKPALCALKLYGAEDRLYSFFRLILLLFSAQLFRDTVPQNRERSGAGKERFAFRTADMVYCYHTETGGIRMFADYQNGLVNLSASILKSFGVEPAHPTLP